MHQDASRCVNPMSSWLQRGIKSFAPAEDIRSKISMDFKFLGHVATFVEHSRFGVSLRFASGTFFNGILYFSPRSRPTCQRILWMSCFLTFPTSINSESPPHLSHVTACHRMSPHVACEHCFHSRNARSIGMLQVRTGWRCNVQSIRCLDFELGFRLSVLRLQDFKSL